MTPNKTALALAAKLAVTLIAVTGAHMATAAEAETDVMGKGNTQLEFKLGISRDRVAAFHETSTPFVARIGVSDTLEVRVVTDGYLKSKVDGVTTSGMADTNLGLRLRLQETDEKTGKVGLAVQLEQGLPTGATAFRAVGGSTALKFTATWALPEDISFGVQPGLVRVRNDESNWYIAPSMSITVAKNWSPKLRTVVELIAPQITSRKNGGNETYLALGATYSLTEMFELEATYARSLNKNAPENNFAAGVNVKF
jgi:Putative MetA-pathway of phenol degradation